MTALELSAADPLRRRDELVAILAGTAAYAPVPDDPPQAAQLRDAFGVGAPIDDDVTLVVGTSGTTGTPKGAQHSAATLAASAAATAAQLGGPGNWLLALPPHHIAGLQVLLRSLGAGNTPLVLDVTAGFDADAFAERLDRLDGPRRYTSLVPTQLHKVLDSPRATAAVRDIQGLLVGGAATPAPLLTRATDAGLPIVRTYGMSETAGGCVYDGVPLPGVTITIAGTATQAGSAGSAQSPGRVELSGPMVAHGYRNHTEHPAFDLNTNTFRTDDLGYLNNGVLHIVGRADEAISSGGLTVVPQVVEAALATDPSVADCAVLGLPDDRLGEQVVAVVVAADGHRIVAETLRGIVADRLGRHSAPRQIIEVEQLPRRGPGKVDRKALRRQLGGRTDVSPE